MILKWWRARKFLRKYVIGRLVDGYQQPYLTRYDILGTRFSNRWPKLFLHRFHRSDWDEALHDHPWPFWSLILWSGYYEVTSGIVEDVFGPGIAEKKRWYRAGSLLRRPADWTHRVELAPGREGKTWSLVFAGKKSRSWGFHCPNGWVGWRDFIARTDNGEAGCE